MDQQFPRNIDRLLSAGSVSALRRVTFGIFRRIGFKRAAYIHSVSGQPGRFFIDQIGFPASVSNGYFNDQNQLDDPFPLATRQFAFPVVWSGVSALQPLSRRYQIYLAKLRAADLGDGISVSVSGPAGRDGYFALGYGCYGPTMSGRGLAELQLTCQAAHNTLCGLSSQSDIEPPGLSKREVQVLFWMARGKTNSATAQILEVSKHTVDTLCKRIYDKLGVNDRVSAVITALRYGIIPHNAAGNE